MRISVGLVKVVVVGGGLSVVGCTPPLVEVVVDFTGLVEVGLTTTVVEEGVGVGVAWTVEGLLTTVVGAGLTLLVVELVAGGFLI